MTPARTGDGHSIVELPVVIWVILLVLFYPMINYATIAIRSCLVFNAAQTAALTASKARSFSTSTATDPSALQVVNDTVHEALDSCDGIKVNKVTTEIVITKMSDKTRTTQSTSLSTPPNTAQNTFQLQVTIDSSVSPFMLIDTQVFGNIAGMTAPYNLIVSQRHYVENTQGLMR